MIEIDITKLERGTRTGTVTVRRGGKVFQRKQRLGQKKRDSVSTEMPPSKKIMDIIKIAVDKGKDYGFTSVTGDGLVGWDDIFIKGKYEPEVTHIDFKISGNTIININNGKSITLTDKFLDESLLGEEMQAGNLGILSNLDISYDSGIAHDYNVASSTSVDEEVLDFIPEYSELSRDEDEMKGKYAPSMNLKYCSNVPPFGEKSLISYFWHSGSPEHTSLVGENIRNIREGEFNKDNILHLPLKLMMETSKIVSDKYGSEHVYRGETNINSAKVIIEGIISDGAVRLSDKVTSWTENEKLGKWYASVHTQRAPGSRTETKSHIMLKLNKDKYLNNVVFDYRACGDRYYPEQEVTIYGKGIKLTGDNVMVYSGTPKRKSKKWISLNQYISEGGNIENLMNQMVG